MVMLDFVQHLQSYLRYDERMSTLPNESLRLFVAVDLAPEVRTVLRDTQARLQQQRLPVRWVDPGGAHVTLKYLGMVAGKQIETITRCMYEIAARHQPFTLSTGALGAFPDLRRARVVWLAVNGNRDALRHLRDDVEATIAPLGFPTEDRPFSPHLTLGRTHKDVTPQQRAAIGEVLAGVAAPHALAWTVGEIVLFRSDAGPAGARYTPLVRTALNGA